MGTLVYIGEFRLGWKVPSSPKNCVAKSERFPQKSLAHQPHQLSKKIVSRNRRDLSKNLSRTIPFPLFLLPPGIAP